MAQKSTAAVKRAVAPTSVITKDMRSFEKEMAATQQWFDSPRFAGILRLYTARQVVEQRGTIAIDYTVAREASIKKLFEK
jgi:isocitrate lyase